MLVTTRERPLSTLNFIKIIKKKEVSGWLLSFKKFLIYYCLFSALERRTRQRRSDSRVDAVARAIADGLCRLVPNALPDGV